MTTIRAAKRRSSASAKAKPARKARISGKSTSIRSFRESMSPGAARIAGKSRLRFSGIVAAEPEAAAKIGAIRSGVSASVMDEMVQYLDAPKAVIFAVLRAPESTAHKAIKEDKALDSATTERVLRIADIARLAEETFGGRENAVAWLKKENRALGGVSPLSMLDTGPGADEVRKILSAINFGGAF
jgi:putative toxin-antitoxin system antitoxin component (TIGR02293 family)